MTLIAVYHKNFTNCVTTLCEKNVQVV
jgi:hypothetical protein